MSKIDETAIRQIFTEARTPKKWLDRAIDPAFPEQLYNLVRMGPTSNNGGPARFAFARSDKSRQRLLQAIHPGNHLKVQHASIITVVCYDVMFWRHWQKLSPHKDMAALFGQSPDRAEEEARMSAILQAGYFILAARALGMDAFPLTGFDPEAIDPTLLRDGWVPIMLCCLGHGDRAALRARADRLSFGEACIVV